MSSVEELIRAAMASAPGVTALTVGANVLRLYGHCSSHDSTYSFDSYAVVDVDELESKLRAGTLLQHAAPRARSLLRRSGQRGDPAEVASLLEKTARAVQGCEVATMQAQDGYCNAPAAPKQTVRFSSQAKLLTVCAKQNGARDMPEYDVAPLVMYGGIAVILTLLVWHLR